jgi:hypothetical protein
VLALDLSSPDALAQLAEAPTGLELGLLVAAAGFGSSGPLLEATKKLVTGEKLARYLSAELRDRIRNTGVKIEVGSESYTLGAAFLDSNSVYSEYYKGDGDIGNGCGAEAYFKYTGKKDLTLFLGVGTGVTAASAAQETALQVDAIELLPQERALARD